MEKTLLRDEKNKTSYIKIWFCFCVFTIVSSVFLQLILLPILAPSSWQVDKGLIAPDSKTYHQQAFMLSQEISDKGWGAWNLRLRGQEEQSLTSLTAAVYSVFFSSPLVLIPINAFLHATAAILLLKIIESILINRKNALFCTLPFLIYPTAANWYAQILKDSYSITGLMLILFSLVATSSSIDTQRGGWLRKSFGYMFLTFIGGGLIWLVRPYMIQLVQVAGMVCLVLLYVKVLFKKNHKGKLVQALFQLTFVAMTLLSLSFFDYGYQSLSQKNKSDIVSLGQPFEIDNEANEESLLEIDNEGNEEFLRKEKEAKESLEINGHLVGVERSRLIRTKEILNGYWERVNLLVNSKLNSIFRNRRNFNIFHPNAKSNIDSQVFISSSMELIAYIPRALQISLLAPFPVHWFSTGSRPENSLMRRIVGLEMVGVYLSLAFLPLAVISWWNRMELWVVAIFCVFGLVFYGCIVSNIGTLHRMRYGFLMPIVSLGLAGFFKFKEDLGY